MKNIQTAITLAGGAKNLAQMIDVPIASVYFWASGERRIPAEYCPAVEKVTAGKVRCEALRPDVDWSVLRAPQPEAA